MPICRVLALVSILVLSAGLHSAARAAEEWLSEGELTALFAGKSVDGLYAGGRSFHESYGRDGRLTYEDELRSSSGHWSVQAGAFCTIYDGDPAGGCFRVRRIGANCYEFFFAARTEADAHRPLDPDWTARAWLLDRASTCHDAAST